MPDKRVVFYVDEGLHSQFKGTAAREAMSLKAAATEAIGDWLEKMLDRQAEADAGVIPLSQKDPKSFQTALEFLRKFDPSQK